MLWTIGGGIIEAAIGEGERQRGNSWLESESRSRRLDEEREKKEALRNMSDAPFGLQQSVVDTCYPCWQSKSHVVGNNGHTSVCVSCHRTPMVLRVC